MRELEKRSGVNRSVLSLAEQGRLVPKGDEFDRVMTALGVTVEAPASAEPPGPADVQSRGPGPFPPED